MELGVEPAMVDAHEREHRGVQIVDADWIFRGAVAEFVEFGNNRLDIVASAFHGIRSDLFSVVVVKFVADGGAKLQQISPDFAVFAIAIAI